MNFTPLEPLNVAFIGGALNSAVGYTHFNASRLDGHFRVNAGCFSRHKEHNHNTARTYGIAEERTYSCWQALLDGERGRLDAVVVLTPIPSHAEIVLGALDAGYAVICEKALGISSEECRKIGAAVAQASGFLAVTYNYSGYPMVRELQRMIKDGRLGKIQQIQIEMPQESYLVAGAKPQDWRLKDYAVPTVSLDLGAHVYHLVSFLTDGCKPLRVVGDQSSNGKFVGLVDNVSCIAHFDKDMRVVAWWGKTALGYRNGLRVRVFGSIASAEWYQLEPENLRWADNQGHYFMLDRGSAEAKTAQQPRYNRFKVGHPSGFIEAFANLYADIAASLRASKHNTDMSGEFVYGAEHSVEILNFLEKVSHSATAGTWIKV